MQIYKRWCVIVMSVVSVGFVIMGIMTIIIDPYFHYHEPLTGWNYFIYNERYQNDGIAKHFDYDAILTGSSMMENAKTSEFDMLFGTHSIKIPFFGGSYKEVGDQIKRAVNFNPNIKIIVRSLDYSMLTLDKDWQTYYGPEYLYNDNYFDDVNYLLNKKTFLGGTIWCIQQKIQGTPSTTFDNYANWMYLYSFGKDIILSDYERTEKVLEIQQLSEKERTNICENIQQNIVDIAEENPEITFYVFLTPYSILYWDDLNQKTKYINI